MWDSKRAHRFLLTRLNTRGGLVVFAACVLLAIGNLLGINVRSSILKSQDERERSGCPWARDNIDREGRSFEKYLCHDPIDVVYTWVNGSDPVWLAAKERYERLEGSTLRNETTEEDGDGANRYRDNQELRYSLRSVERFAPWVRHIYIVTDNQIPYWLDMNNARMTLVSHREIFPSEKDLPVFNSPAIETHIHRIPGLSRRFIYFNDDTFLGSPVWPDDFVTSTGQRVYFSWEVPRCSEGCIPRRLGDGVCDRECNVSRCEFDVGDCVGNVSEVRGSYRTGSNAASNARSKECSRGCRPHWIADNVCDMNCKTAACAFDAPDCGMDMIYDAGANGSIAALRLFPLETVGNLSESLVMTAHVSSAPTAVYVNMRDTFASVSKAEHDNDDGIFASIVAQEDNVLVVVYNDNGDDPAAALRPTRFFVEGTAVGATDEDEAVNVTFVLVRREETSGAVDETVSRWIAEDNTTTTTTTTTTTESATMNTEIRRSIGGGRRRLLADVYGDSLVHVNNMYTRDFGPVNKARRVPAHMPHMIDREAIERLQRRFASAFRTTSSSRFRRSDDVQYAFAYFHWLIHSARSVDFRLETFWRETLDADRDGRLSENEMHTLATIVFGGTPSESEREELVQCLAPSQTRSMQWRENGGVRTAVVTFQPDVVFDRLSNCTDISKRLDENAPREFEPQIVDDPDRFVAFEMIDDDLDRMKTKLDSVRRRRPKFVCINDDMKEPTEEHDRVLRDFYESFFGIQSQFELPYGTRNSILRVEDLRVQRDAGPLMCVFDRITNALSSMPHLALILFFLATFSYAYCRKAAG